MGSADNLNKVYIMMEWLCLENSDVYLKPGPFMLDYVTWNDGSDAI